MMSRMKSRLVAAFLVCATIGGCASSGVGTPLPNGGHTRFVTYAPPGAQLGLKIYDIGLEDIFSFAPNSVYDNHAIRPAGIPSSYVAYTVDFDLPAGTFDADLMHIQFGQWVFADGVDPFEPNELILVHED